MGVGVNKEVPTLIFLFSSIKLLLGRKNRGWGSITPFSKDKAVLIILATPLAASRCPILALIEPRHMGWPWKALDIAPISNGSPVGAPVP